MKEIEFRAKQILKAYYGYDEFRPMQEEVILHVVQGMDALVLMPTGGGKSLCFQIPALMLEGTAVVISPLISLMKDQVDALSANGVDAAALNSTNSEDETQLIKGRCRCGELKILYISPERFVLETSWMQQYMKASLIAIDEAHCISQWGHDFRPEYTQLSALHEQFPSVPILALTATADKLTKVDIARQLDFQDYKEFVSSFNRPNLSLDVRKGYSAKDKMKTIMSVIHRHRGESGIVYCLSRKGCEQMAEKLKDHGVSVGVYHAGLSSDERSRVQEDFLNDRVNVICATIAFGMGIDKSNVRYVIHNNLPKSIESFYQEIGRGGRDGMDAETILFYNLQDIITLRKFAEESGQRDINIEKLNRMQEYAEAQVCRRRILLNYFGEHSDCKCDNCDVCKNPPKRFDGTILVQKALSAIIRANEQVGISLTVDVLRGVESDKVLMMGFDKLKTFGAGRDVSARNWKDYLLQLLQMGYIEIAYDEDKHIKITPLGKNVLYGRQQVMLTESIREDLRVKRGASPQMTNRQPVVKDQEDKALFVKLKELRKSLAEEHSWPAYIVMSDKSLHELAATKPTNLIDFSNTFGIGEHKTKTYGARFIELISTYIETPKQAVNVQPEISGDSLLMSHMDRQKQLYEKAYAPWTNEDDEKLLRLYQAGATIADLSAVFKRNNGAIRSRLRKIGLEL